MTKLKVVQKGMIEFSKEEGVKECRPTCSLLEIANFRLLIDLEHPKEDKGQFVRAIHGVGTAPEEIDGVLFTHLHPDHIGHKELFRHALFIFHESEKLKFCFQNDRTLLLKGHTLIEFGPTGSVKAKPVTEEPSLKGLGDQIYVRHIPGHTLGSVVFFAVVENLVHAWVGDTFLNQEYFDGSEVPGFSLDPAAVRGHMEYIKQRADVIIPGHGAPFFME